MRANAGGPAKGEGQTQHISAKGRSTLIARFKPDIAVQKPDPVNANEMRAENHHDHACDGGKSLCVAQKKCAERRSCKPQQHEHGREAQHKKQRGHNGRAPALHVCHGNPAHIRKVWRHNWQNAGREERQKPGEQRHQHGRDQTCIYDVDTKHVCSCPGCLPQACSKVTRLVVTSACITLRWHWYLWREYFGQIEVGGGCGV